MDFKKPAPLIPTVSMGGMKVSRVAFGTEHLNQYHPNFGGAILKDAALLHNVFFWDTDNCYGSQSTVAAGMKMLDRERVVVASKTYARTEEDAETSVEAILHDLDTPYLDLCLLHGVAYGGLSERMPALAALRRMKDKGLIRHIGLSTHSAQVAWDTSDVEGVEVLCVTFNRDGSRTDQGSVSGMVRALEKAHNQKGLGTYVIKALGRGDLIYDLRAALRWVMDNHHCIDVYNLGVSCLAELRQNVEIVNEYYGELEAARNG